MFQVIYGNGMSQHFLWNAIPFRWNAISPSSAVSPMASDEGEDIPPFSPEQLAWIDRLVEAHTAAVTNAAVPVQPPHSGPGPSGESVDKTVMEPLTTAPCERGYLLGQWWGGERPTAGSDERVAHGGQGWGPYSEQRESRWGHYSPIFFFAG